MIFAVLQPGALTGLAVGFIAAVIIRAIAQSLVLRVVFGVFRPPRLGHVLDIAGLLTLAVSGAGFAAAATEPPATTQWGRRFLVVAAGPVAVIAVGQAVFSLAASLGEIAGAYRLSDVLRGVPPTRGIAAQALLAAAVAVTAFGLVALIPIPPLDGWTMLTNAGIVASQPILDHGGRWVLLAISLIPYQDRCVLHVLVDVLGAPLILPWKGALPWRGE